MTSLPSQLQLGATGIFFIALLTNDVNVSFKLKTKTQLEIFFGGVGWGEGSRLFKSFMSRFCETIEGLEGQNKVKSACHIERMNWVLYLDAVTYNLDE